MLFFGLFLSLLCIELEGQKSIVINDDIQLIQLNDSLFIHKSWHSTERFGRFPSNGMLLVKEGKAMMVDTPMDVQKTKILAEFLNDSLGISIEKIIIGHYHNDCLGGLAFLKANGVESIANSLTLDKCIELNLPLPDIEFNYSYTVDFYGEKIECYFPGGGHSIDNIVVFFQYHGILFGGCLVKSMGSRNLGNLNDAVLKEWAPSITNVREKYKDGIRLVVPGHGDHGGPELLEHTLQLLKDN